MRVLLRSTPWFVALGVGLAIGCTESNDAPTKTLPSQAGSAQTKAPPSKVAGAEYVLTVEGMT
jgi:hypothetical protein